MPFLPYDPLDAYEFSFDLVGRTENYEFSFDLVGRTENYELSLDLVGRTSNYQFSFDLNGSTDSFRFIFGLNGYTLDPNSYEFSFLISGTTQRVDGYEFIFSLEGATDYLPGTSGGAGGGTGTGTGPTGPGPGSSGPGSNTGDGSFGGEGLVYHILNKPGFDMVIFPWLEFTASYEGLAAPTGTITLLGKIDSLPGDLYVSAKATGIDGVVYSSSYGPFKSVGSIEQTKDNGQWKTKISFKDTTIDDTLNTEDPETQMPILPELVPWEAEVQGTPLQVAEKRKARDLLERELRKKYRCGKLLAALYDPREMLVDALVLQALSYLKIPYVLVSPPPFPGSKIYAEKLITNGGYPNPLGTLVGTSASTLEKKPLEVMGEFWGAVGYTYKVIRGVVYIGQKDKIAEKEAELSGGKLNIAHMEESNLMETYSIERLNEGSTVTDDPQPASGSYSLPSSITIKGAATRKWLPPLPPDLTGGYEVIEVEKDLDAFEKDPDGTLESYRDIDGVLVLRDDTLTIKYDTVIAREHETTTKKGGLIRAQKKVKDGWVYYTDTDGENRVYWRNIYTEITDYYYEDTRFPTTLTKTIVTRTKVDQEGLLNYPDLRLGDIVEVETLSKKFHYSGYLMERTTTKNELSHFVSSAPEDDGDTRYRYPVYKTSSTIETYLPIKNGRWLYKVLSEYNRAIRTLREASDTNYTNSTKYGVTVENFGDSQYQAKEETDQAPEYATVIDDKTKADNQTGDGDVECIDEPDIIKNGYSYDTPAEYTVHTGGRGDPITINLPFLNAAPNYTMDQTLKQFAERYIEANKLINKIRYRGTFFVPVDIARYGEATSVNITLTPSKTTVDFTLEGTSV